MSENARPFGLPREAPLDYERHQQDERDALLGAAVAVTCFVCCVPAFLLGMLLGAWIW